MEVFVFDRDPQPRDWRMLLGCEPSPWSPYDDLAEPGDILVCHWSSVTAELETVAAAVAARGVIVFFVSGAGMGGRVDAGVYRRHAVLGKSDPSFAASFRLFVRHLKRHGQVRWDLLEPIGAPEHLLAYYLCLVADRPEYGRRELSDGRSLAQAAEDEYRQLTHILQAEGSPSEDSEFALPNIQTLLRAL